MRSAPLTDGADCRMRFQLAGECLRVWAEGTSSFASTVACWQQIVEQVRALGPYCEIHAREVGLDARVFEDEDSARLWLRDA